MATIFFEYTVHLRDVAQVAALQAADSRIWSPVNGVSGGLVAYPDSQGQLFCNPRRAVELYDATLIVNNEAAPPDTGAYISTLYFPGPQHTDQFEAGADTVVWVGRFAYATDVAQPPVEPFAPFMQRKWICGFNQVATAAGASGVDGDRVQYGSGRHPGQRGYKISGSNSPAVMPHNILGIAAANNHWERFYLRPRVYPSSSNRFWAINHSLSGSRGARLDLLSNGTIAVSSMVTGGSTLVATTLTALTLGSWHRIDILVRCGTTGAGPYLRLYINGVQELHVAFSPSGEGLGEGSAVIVFGQSILGTDFSGATLQADAADWIGAEHPPDLADLQGIDWRHGSKVIPIRVTGLGPAGAGNWTGTPLWVERDFADALTSADNLTNAINAASLIEYDTDAQAQVDDNPEAVGGGVVAVVARVHASRGNVNDATMGYSIAGVPTDVATSMATTLGWRRQAYLPTGLEDPVPIHPFRIRLTRSTGTGTAELRAASAEAEILGYFGPEDPTSTPTTPAVPAVVEHNQPYVNSPWARFTAPPLSPVIIKSGTFAGNDTETVLTFRAPVSWLYIRRVTATQLHSLWWSCKGSAAQSGYQHIAPDIVRRVTYTWDEEAAEARVVLSGTATIANDVAATYQYVAVCDPGARFVLNGAVIGPGREADVFNAYEFPEWGSSEDGGGPVLATWLHRFSLSAGGGSTIAQYFKGPGFGNATKPFDGTANQNDYMLALSGSESGLTTQATLHDVSYEEITYSAWKRLDGSDDPNAHKIVNIGSYTGDGSASRTINLAPTTGLRPVLAFVVPANGTVPIFRDSSHTGTTSTAIHGTANASTGITGGNIDQISVGSALNASGVVYAYFILYGGSCNNGHGWSCDDEFEHVTPAPPPKWPIDPTLPEIPPVPPVDPPDPGGPGPGPGPSPGPIDFEECPTESQKVINQALSYIGVTTPVVDITADLTPEAEQGRLHYEDAVAVVLKRFPWTWATAYADLELVAGSEDDPVNGDWTYAYRLPDNYIHARRVVNPDTGRDHDENPIRFRVGHDEESTGLLYSDYIEEDTETVELEYTYRPGCSALVGDVIFREALAWFMASKLAPGLARNKMKASDCLEMFEYWLSQAMVQNRREQQDDPTSGGDAPWIQGRE